jgi:hypothetical protein
MAHFVIIEHCSGKGPQRFFDMPLPIHGEKDWYRNSRSYESFKTREQKRTTSNMAWRKSGGGLWYYCAWEDDYKCSQGAFEECHYDRKNAKALPVPGENQILVFNRIIERIDCKSMAEFYAHVGWDHPNKKWLPDSKVMTWQK